MSRAAALWSRIAAATAIALVLVLAVSPSRPVSRLPWPAQPVVGLAAGGLLFVVATRRRPHLPSSAGSFPVLVAKHGILGLWAVNEEILWRRIVLGELLPIGSAEALAASTIGFALAHRARRGLHLGTGATFGGVYLATGGLIASVAAHWTYNTLVGGIANRARSPAGAASRGRE